MNDLTTEAVDHLDRASPRASARQSRTPGSKLPVVPRDGAGDGGDDAADPPARRRSRRAARRDLRELGRARSPSPACAASSSVAPCSTRPTATSRRAVDTAAGARPRPRPQPATAARHPMKRSTMTEHHHAPRPRPARPPRPRRTGSTARAPGDPGRTAPVYDPALGVATKQVALADQAEIDAAVARPKAAFPRWRDTSLAKRQQIIFRFRELLNARKGELAEIITREHGKVLSRRARRDHPRPGGRRVRDRARRTSSRASTPSTCRPASTSTRRSSRSASSASSARSTSRRWCRCGSSRSRSRRATRSCSSRARRTRRPRSGSAQLWKEAGLPDGVFNVLHGDKVAVDGLLDHPDVRVDLVRRLDPDRAVHLRDGRARTASGCRPSAARRTTCSCCPTPTSTSSADSAINAGLRLGRRALHGHLRRRRGRAGRRRPHRQDHRADGRP